MNEHDRKVAIAHAFTVLVDNGNSVIKAAEIVSIKYDMSRQQVLEIVREIKGNLSAS